MNDKNWHELPNTADFFRFNPAGMKASARDREKGSSIFLSLSDHARIALIASILDTWLEDGDLNRAMAGGALRHAWDSEPYVGGIRIGSYISSAVSSLEDATFFTLEEFIEEWGAHLMSSTEEREFNAMNFPLTVYRGGTGIIDKVASGVSWTLKREVASFYAHDWPRRWGITAEPVILSGRVDESEAFAFLNDRGEAEILVPYPSYLTDLKVDPSISEVPLAERQDRGS